jgi:tetratricopeptide (TPR) repeat protein
MKQLLLILSILVLSFNGFSQGNPKVAEAFKNKDWKAAISLLKETTVSQPQNALAWMQLGTAYLYADNSTEADKAYAKANEFSIPPLITNFQKAKVYGDKGNTENSLVWLAKAVDNGYSDLNKINSEPTLEKVRATPKFKEIIDKLNMKVNPCKYSKEHRAFDFWVGEWQVFDHNQGFPVGTSKIEKLVGDCIIYENWADTQSIGKSFNYYDASINKWRQNWVSQNGGIIWYEGELRDGKMEYEGERITPKGEKFKTRVTFSPQPDGSVRQTAADFTNGAWVVNFDADYRKAK